MPSVSRSIIWSVEAEEDLFQIWAYLAQHASPAVADRQLRAIRRGSRRLVRLPYSGRPRDDLVPGIRSILVAPYVVFYRVTDATVDIVRILHGRRDLEVIFNH